MTVDLATLPPSLTAAPTGSLAAPARVGANPAASARGGGGGGAARATPDAARRGLGLAAPGVGVEQEWRVLYDAMVRALAKQRDEVTRPQRQRQRQ